MILLKANVAKMVTQMLFPKTIQSFQNTQKHVIKDTLFDMIHSDGISVSSVDLIFGHYFIYVLLGEGMLAPVFLYEKRISYKQSQTNGLPRLHFCQCDNIQTDFNPTNKHHTLTHRHYTAKITKRNAFSLSIKQGISEVGLYNDYPLELCPLCSDILKQMREGQTIDSTLSVYVFKNQYLELLEANPTLRQKEMIALQVANLECYKCKKHIDIDSSIWIQIHDNILKICCC